MNKEFRTKMQLEKIAKYKKQQEKKVAKLDPKKEAIKAYNAEKAKAKEEKRQIKIAAVKKQLEEGKAFLGQYPILKSIDKSEETTEAWREAYNKASKEQSSKAVQDSVKHAIKRNNLVATMAINISYGEDQLKFIPLINVGKESALTRLTKRTSMPLSTEACAHRRMSTLDILSVSMSKEFLGLGKDKNRQKLYNETMSGIRDKGISIAYNRKTGRFLPVQEDFKITKDEVLYTYEFLGITASGLRSGTLMFSKTKVNGISVDNRKELLNKLTGEFFSDVFEVSVKALEEDAKLFKQVNRLSLGFSDSKVVGEAKNIVVIDKFVDNKEVLCLDGTVMKKNETMDGRYFLKSSVVKANKDMEGFSDYVIGQQVIQSRSENGGIKAAADIISNRMMPKYVKEFINTSNVLYVIKDGVRMSLNDIQNLEEFYQEVEVLIDTNALKVPAYGSLKINLMKQAYVTESKLTMMVNMMMMYADSSRFEALMDKKYKEAMLEKAKGLGVLVSTDGLGNIQKMEVNREGVKNNEATMASFLMKSSPELVIALLPALVRSSFSATVKSVANMTNGLNPQIESKYMVVQSDLSAQFGAEILEAKPGNVEIYCPEFDNKVAGVRYPISTHTAVTVFNPVNLGDIAERIAKSNMTKEQKEIVLHSFSKCKKYAIIPGSEDLMQLHDGLDFDIDSMCFIVDEEAVSILDTLDKEVTMIGEDRFRCSKTPQDVAVETFLTGKKPLIIPNGIGEKKTEDKKVNDGIIPGINLGKTGLETKEIVTDPFLKQFDLMNNYFKNACASIGEIATGHYNNLLLVMELMAGSAHSEYIAKTFRSKYKCAGADTYVSPVNRSEVTAKGYRVIKLDKETCINVLRNYQSSNGSIESTLLFLKDCVSCNRYVGETAIDAVKNGYFVADYFNHCHIIKAMGSDKTVEVKEEENNEEFLKYLDAARTSLGNAEDKNTINALNCKVLMHNKKNGKNVYAVGSKEAANATERDVIAVPDSYYKIKNSLVVYANTIIAICSELLCSAIESERSAEIRKEFVKISSGINSEKYVKGAKIVQALNSILVNKEVLVDTYHDINDISSKMANKEILMPKTANTVALAFEGYDEISVGAIFVQAMIGRTDLANKGYGSVNQKFVEVMGRYIIALFEEMGSDLSCYEKITIAERGASLKDMVGLEGKAESGFVTTDAGTVELSNHKLDGVAGKITEDKMFKFGRAFVEMDPKAGIFAIATPDKKIFNVREGVNGKDAASNVIGNFSKFISGRESSYRLATNNGKSDISELSYVADKNVVKVISKGDTSILLDCVASTGAKMTFRVTGSINSINAETLAGVGSNPELEVYPITTDDEHINILIDINSQKLRIKLNNLMKGNKPAPRASKEEVSNVSFLEAMMEGNGLAEVALDVTEEAGPATIGSVNDFCF